MQKRNGSCVIEGTYHDVRFFCPYSTLFLTMLPVKLFLENLLFFHLSGGITPDTPPPPPLSDFFWKRRGGVSGAKFFY